MNEYALKLYGWCEPLASVAQSQCNARSVFIGSRHRPSMTTCFGQYQTILFSDRYAACGTKRTCLEWSRDRRTAGIRVSIRVLYGRSYLCGGWQFGLVVTRWSRST